jgi:hypothetical protein
MSPEITYDGDVDAAIGFFVTAVDECDNTYLGTDGPFWSKEEMEANVASEAQRPGAGEIYVHCIPIVPYFKAPGVAAGNAEKNRSGAEGEVVWQNECKLVSEEIGLVYKGDLPAYAHTRRGQMGVNHYDGQNIYVCIESHNEDGKHDIFESLLGVPVRITIERVPGGIG